MVEVIGLTVATIASRSSKDLPERGIGQRRGRIIARMSTPTSPRALQAPVIGLRDLKTGVAHRVAREATTCIGTDPGNDIVVTDACVSRAHCRLRWQDGELWLEDLGSKNGTFLDSFRIYTAEIEDGQLIQVGTTKLIAFADKADRWRRDRSWLIGDHPSFLAAVEGAVAAAEQHRGVVLRGERGTGRSTIAAAVHGIICGAHAPYMTAHLVPPVLFAHLDRWKLERDVMRGLVHLHGLDEASAKDRDALVPPVLEAAREGWLHFAISVAPGHDPGAVPGHLPVVDIPRLCDRGDDLRLLVDPMVQRAFGADDLPGPIVDALLRYTWPGHVAELEFAVSCLESLRRTGSVEAAERELGESEPDIVVPGGAPVLLPPYIDSPSLVEWFARRGIPSGLLAN